MSIQRYLPIVEEGKTNRILGLIDLADNVTFDGTEVEYELTTEPGGNQDLVITKIEVPESTQPRNPWYMAAVFTHQQVYEEAHRNLTVFIPIEDVAPEWTWSSGSGLAHVRRGDDGVIIRGLSKENGFGLGGTPYNTVVPTISGTLEVGEELTADEGTWMLGPDTFAIQWQIENGAEWDDVADETAETFTPLAAGTYRVRYIGTNEFGTSGPAYSEPAVVVAP